MLFIINLFASTYNIGITDYLIPHDAGFSQSLYLYNRLSFEKVSIGLAPIFEIENGEEDRLDMDTLYLSFVYSSKILENVPYYAGYIAYYRPSDNTITSNGLLFDFSLDFGKWSMIGSNILITDYFSFNQRKGNQSFTFLYTFIRELTEQWNMMFDIAYTLNFPAKDQKNYGNIETFVSDTFYLSYRLNKNISTSFGLTFSDWHRNSLENAIGISGIIIVSSLFSKEF